VSAGYVLGSMVRISLGRWFDGLWHSAPL
jgi:hypothetical protein